VVRYPWYAASLAGGAPGWLTWARYSAFLVLYPIGVVSEMWLLYSGLPAVRQQRLHSMALPNRWNFAFNYSYFLVVRCCPTSGISPSAFPSSCGVLLPDDWNFTIEPLSRSGCLMVCFCTASDAQKPFCFIL
jgi:Protein tyrosine phosphatase-like protein, PTPLA